MAPTSSAPAAVGRSRAHVLARLWELARFGSVGAVAFVVDMGLFNLLVHGPGDVLGHKPLTAKVVSVAVATVVSWLGNRYWTFSERRTRNRLREFSGFVVVNVGGMAVAVACLATSRYVLGLDSALADNVAANGVGLVLGMVFRYLAYRSFVFTSVGSDERDAEAPVPGPGRASGAVRGADGPPASASVDAPAHDGPLA